MNYTSRVMLTDGKLYACIVPYWSMPNNYSELDLKNQRPMATMAHLSEKLN